MNTAGLVSLSVATLAWGTCAYASAQIESRREAEPRIERPPYRFQRFEEDWSVLRDEKRRGLDTIKYVELGRDPDVWLSFGGHARLRIESWDGFGFGAPTPDGDTFGLWRVLSHGDLHWGEHLRAFVELKYADGTGRDLPGGRRPTDVDTAAVEQAFADVAVTLRDATLTLRGGRQTFLFGAERLVSPLAWANTLRRFDGVSAILDWGVVRATALWAQLVPVRRYTYNRADADRQLFGLYATAAASPQLGFDLYYLGSTTPAATYNGTTGNEERYTAGGRLFGQVGTVDYDLEAAVQYGRVGSSGVRAYMTGAQVGYRPTDGDLRMFAGLDIGSGDDAPGGRVQTFSQLYPLGHAHLGYADVVGRQNVIDLSAGGSLRAGSSTDVRLAYHDFSRESRSDALYDASGAVVRTASGSGAGKIASEVDLTVTLAPDPQTQVLFGYSHVFAGSFLSQTGPDDDIDFLYAQLTYVF